MAKKADDKVVKKVKPDQKQKIIVEVGRAMSTPIVAHEVLHTEFVASAAIAKERIKELAEEYKDRDALSVSYFSV